MEVLSTNMMSELDILGHYGNMFHVDPTKVGIIQEAGQIVLCRAMTMCTWKHRSYFPAPWVILQTRCKKGACVWAAQCSSGTGGSCRGLVSLAGTFRASYVGQPFRNSLHGALPPTVGWSSFLAGSSPAGSEGPASAAICLVGDNPGNHPPLPITLPHPPSCPSHLG